MTLSPAQYALLRSADRRGYGFHVTPAEIETALSLHDAGLGTMGVTGKFKVCPSGREALLADRRPA